MDISAVVLLFTENCTEETRKSKEGKRSVLMYAAFLITEVFCRKAESNRIDFPKQIRIKRKYLTSQDEVPIPCWIGAEDSVRCAEADRDIVRYVDEADKADDGICGAADVRSGRLSQVNKGIRRMPRRFETKKDAISCDKLRRAASKL